MWSGELLGKCAAMHECSSRCTQVITENKLENKYNGRHINSVSTTITTFGSGCAEERMPFQQSCKFSFFLFFFFGKTSPPVEQMLKKKKPHAAGAAVVNSVSC